MARPNSKVIVLASVVAVASALGVLYASDLLSGLAEPPGTPVESRPAPEEAAAPEPVVAARAEMDPRGLSVQSGGRLEIVAASLPAGAPVVLNLLLPERPEGTASLPVRVVAYDGRVLQTSGTVGGEGRPSASVEIEPDWLSPGAYLVELTTAERNHFPLRRYGLVVR